MKNVLIILNTVLTIQIFHSVIFYIANENFITVKNFTLTMSRLLMVSENSHYAQYHIGDGGGWCV